MKVQSLLPWCLAGGLVASSIWNFQLLQRLETIEARLAAPTPPAAIPGSVVTTLKLSKQQCEFIEGCSMT